MEVVMTAGGKVFGSNKFVDFLYLVVGNIVDFNKITQIISDSPRRAF